MGFEGAARFIARRHCTVFWVTLLTIILMGASAVLILRADAQRLRGTSSIFAERTDYDWTVVSTQQDDQDMVNSALDTALPLSGNSTAVVERSQPADTKSARARPHARPSLARVVRALGRATTRPTTVIELHASLPSQRG